MVCGFVTAKLKLPLPALNRNGFTFLTAIFMVMIMGIMLGLTGQSWKTIMKREREKELIFRGSQIKEAIENWNNQAYTVNGAKWNGPPQQLMDLKDLLKNPRTLTSLQYLAHHYAQKLDDKNPKCAPDCAQLKIYQDPMTGKEWTLIRGNIDASGNITPNAAAGIIGVASKSEEEPLRTDFKDTALENMGKVGLGSITDVTGTINLEKKIPGESPTPANAPGKMTKYSEWKFIAESPQKNDHKKIYRAYHEGW
jgi:type II secretory pathway pseudopilin PulG